MLAVANVVSLIEKRKSADSERQYKGANLHPSQDSKFSYRPNEHVIRCLNFFFFSFSFPFFICRFAGFLLQNRIMTCFRIYRIF